MTNQERAEKIAADYCGGGLLSNGQAVLLAKRIAVELDGAVNEAIDDIALGYAEDKLTDKIFQKGFAAAQEKAAGILEESDYCECGSNFCNADHIRAMQPDGK